MSDTKEVPDVRISETEDSRHLTSIPDVEQVIPGAKTYHPEGDALKAFGDIQEATPTHTTALAVPIESQVSNAGTPIPLSQKPGGNLLFKVVGSRSGEDWSTEFKKRQLRKGEIKHAA